MTDAAQVAVGIIDGMVVCRWREPITEIVFDPQNAYTIGIHLSRAALEAHRGSENAKGDLEFIANELAEVRMKVSDMDRARMIGAVATIVKTLMDKKQSPGYIAMHAVDEVLKETAR